MKKSIASITVAPMDKMKSIIMDTDIRILVFVPPVIGFGSFLAGFILMEYLTSHMTPLSVIEITLGVACFIQCFAGVAQVLKREMPGPFGKILTGRIAVISGIMMIFVFGLSGIIAISYGIANFLAGK
jgi:hypothetical protein